MTFSQLLHAVRQNPHAVVIPSVWGQGRAGFGGLAVALVFGGEGAPTDLRNGLLGLTKG